MGSGAANGDGELRAQDLGAVGAGPNTQLDATGPAFAVVAFVVAGIANLATRDAIPITTAAGWILVVCAWAAAGRVRAMHGEREAIRLCLANTSLAAALWFTAGLKLCLPVVSNSTRPFDATPPEAAAVLAALIAAAVGPTLALGWARELTATSERILRRVAWGGVFAVALVSAFAVRRATTAPPSTAVQITGTEVARLCPVGERCPTRVYDGPRTGTSPTAGVTVIDAIAVRGVRIERYCVASVCTVSLHREDEGSPGESESHASVHAREFAGANGVLLIRRNERFGFWLAEAPLSLPYDDRLRADDRVRAFDENLRPTSLSVRHVGPDYSAPRGWLYGAIAGVLFSAALLLWPARKYRGPRPEQCTEGYHDGAGTLLVNGVPAGTLHEQSGVFTEGPVLWVRSEHSSEAPYRATLPIDGVRAGTLADLRFAHAAPALARSLFALTALALTSAPLFAAALAGLVF